ncbi:MAG TPA: DUF167 domain-containing protein [Candidatus Paceibacterota bacterium]|nr:DUF167 domain-containing protein [Candidatus Paceibacterota bacterium]
MKAKPGAKTERVQKISDGLFANKNDLPSFTVAVKERAVDGRANRAIEKVLATYLKVPLSRVRIISGLTSREKIVEVAE